MRPALPSLSKVPEITAVFWITKVLTTGMGESTSDYLVLTLGPAIAIGIGAVVFALAIIVQFRVRRYIAGVYWFAVVMVSVFGTMAADVLHVGLGIPYLISTIFFSVVLAAIFATWYLTQRSLSIHSITTRPRELFYWATVLTTFALGTASGDLTATSFHLGYLGSGILFAVVIAVPAIAWWKFRLNAIPAFWFAYVTTRPLGASFADWMAVSHQRGGLNWGTGPVSLALSIVILGFVVYLGVSRRIAVRRIEPATPA
ncbi:MAG TPA: hypothetical protein VK537_06765 [Galbitalea sp.]|nr:hypothetical protein [Galbitalea sp.]